MSATGLDGIERVKDHARQMYPNADVAVKAHRGHPVVLASEGNLIRIVRYHDLDADGLSVTHTA